jgi:glycosyltransferase involved in cell wall biosynthesis
MATKGIYVDTHSGWFSERSICYLASGRPVIAQDTGLGEIYPIGEGLLTFTTLEEAAACVDEVLSNYQRQSQAARRLAEEYFDSDKVLTQLLKKLDLAPALTSKR